MATAMSPAAANLMIARIEVSSLPVWGCFAGHFTEFFDKQDSDPYSPGTCEFGTFRNIALVGTLVPRLSAVAITADRSATTMLHHACPQSRPDGLDILYQVHVWVRGPETLVMTSFWVIALVGALVPRLFTASLPAADRSAGTR